MFKNISRILVAVCVLFFLSVPAFSYALDHSSLYSAIENAGGNDQMLESIVDSLAASGSSYTSVEGMDIVLALPTLKAKNYAIKKLLPNISDKENWVKVVGMVPGDISNDAKVANVQYIDENKLPDDYIYYINREYPRIRPDEFFDDRFVKVPIAVGTLDADWTRVTYFESTCPKYYYSADQVVRALKQIYGHTYRRQAAELFKPHVLDAHHWNRVESILDDDYARPKNASKTAFTDELMDKLMTSWQNSSSTKDSSKVGTIKGLTSQFSFSCEQAKRLISTISDSDSLRDAKWILEVNIYDDCSGL